MEEARRAATFRVENENGKGGKTSTKILRTKRCMQYAVQIKNLSQAQKHGLKFEKRTPGYQI